MTLPTRQTAGCCRGRGGEGRGGVGQGGEWRGGEERRGEGRGGEGEERGGEGRGGEGRGGEGRGGEGRGGPHTYMHTSIQSGVGQTSPNCVKHAYIGVHRLSSLAAYSITY